MKEGVEMLVGAQQWENVVHGKNVGKNLSEALFMDLTLLAPGVDEVRAAGTGLYLTYVAGDAERASKVMTLSKSLATSQRTAQAKNLFEATLEKQITRTVVTDPERAARPMTELEKSALQREIDLSLQKRQDIESFLKSNPSFRNQYEGQLKELDVDIQKLQTEMQKDTIPARKPITWTETSKKNDYDYNKLENFRNFLDKKKKWGEFSESLETGNTDTLFAELQAAADKRQAEVDRIMKERLDEKGDAKEESKFWAAPQNTSSSTLSHYKSTFRLLEQENERKGFSRFILGKSKVSSIGSLQRRNAMMYYGAVSLTNEGISYSSQDS